MTESKGFIYIIKNIINDKVYVGQTTKTIEKRWKRHRQLAGILLRYKQGELEIDLDVETYRHVFSNKLYNAMYELGVDNFHIEHLEEVEKSVLNDFEIFFISLFNCVYPNGYNGTTGGGSMYQHSQATKDLIRMIKIQDIDSKRNPILAGLPANTTYGSNDYGEFVRPQNHPRTYDKFFYAKDYGESLENAKKALADYLQNLEDKDIVNLGRKSDTSLPPGVSETAKGFWIQKTHKKIIHRAGFEKPNLNPDPEINRAMNKQAALKWYDELKEKLGFKK